MVTKEDVKNAIEYKWRGSQWKLYLVIMVLILFLIPVLAIAKGTDLPAEDRTEILLSAIGFVAVLYGVCFVPVIVYPVWRQWEMLHRCGCYQRYRVKLCNPVNSWSYRRAVGYRVAFQTETGETVVQDPRPLFSSSALATFQLEDYNNKTVDIFYDPEKDKVILVGNPR